MPSTQDFEDLYGVTEERALNFWASHLHEAIGSERWSRICDSTGVYLASVLGHFCLQSIDRMEVLSPDYRPRRYRVQAVRDLTQIAELMMRQLTSCKEPSLDGVSRRTHPPLRRILPTSKQAPAQHRVLLHHGPGVLPHGRRRKQGKDDEADGSRLQPIPLPSSRPPPTSTRKQIPDKASELGHPELESHPKRRSRHLESLSHSKSSS